MKIDMPENANRIITTLEAAGYEAYIVGGCVRDSILGLTPEDWDITTSARPEQVKTLFRRTLDTGIKHGTVTVMFGKEGYEVTTYRIDGKYTDHRRPEQVEYTASLKEDLKRRDFTINAMAYSHKQGVIDLFGGREDLERKLVRAVGCAAERFDEDALRILRAVRFSGQLDFEIESETKKAMMAQAKYLTGISAERIREELTKLLLSAHPEKLVDAYEMGITFYILPEFDAMMKQPQNNPHHQYTVGAHTIEVIKEVEPTVICRFGALLHDVGKPAAHSTDEKGIDHFYKHSIIGAEIAETVLKRLRFDNDSVKTICKLVLWHDYGMGECPGKKSFRNALSKMGTDFFPLYVQIKRADIMAQSNYHKEDKWNTLKTMESMYREILEDEDCLKIRDLAINGKDLIALGIKPGKEMGDILSGLLNSVLEDPALNTRVALLETVRCQYLK